MKEAGDGGAAMQRRRRVGACLLALWSTTAGAAQEDRRITDLSLEELSNLVVVSVSRRDPRHVEFGAAPGRSEFRRGVFAKVVVTP